MAYSPSILNRLPAVALSSGAMRSGLSILVLVLAAVGCARTADHRAAEAEIIAADRAWLAAVERRDVGAAVSYWTDDATLIQPGVATLQGSAAIRQFVETALKTPGFRITWSAPERIDVSPDGTFAYTLARSEVTAPGQRGQLVTTHARGVAVWRKQSDGKWRCVADIATEEPPSGAPGR